MYAVIQAGGHQLVVSRGQEVRIDRIQGDVGGTHVFEKVLMIGGGERIHVGHPFLKSVVLEAEILEHGKGKKVIVFKKRRRKNYRRKAGFRAQFTLVRINGLKGIDVPWHAHDSETMPVAGAVDTDPTAAEVEADIDSVDLEEEVSG